MLPRIFWLACLICHSTAGPLTKIEGYSNDLAQETNEDFEDKDVDLMQGDAPKIYEDEENLETVKAPRKYNLVAKRMAVDGAKAVDKKEFMAYVSKHISDELPGANLSDLNDVQRLVGAVFKLYGEYTDRKMVADKLGVTVEDNQMMMMSDQPQNDDGGFKKISVPTFELPVSSSDRPSSSGLTAEEILDRENKERRNNVNEDTNENRTRDMYLAAFKTRILANINRPNISVPSFPNFIIPFPAQTMSNGSDSPYTEKIRSFYPTCDVPKNTKDAWKEENLLNLFFNVDYNQNATIATATLRLHRLPRENQTSSYWNSEICPEGNVFEEEKLLRVSIYWYVRSAKKHSKVKRRLCDSKMISENSPWVELSVKAATKTWTKSGKNMGLAILVEDQDGGTLKASKYFKGATCTVGTVGTPTPRPIPTLITDTARYVNDSAAIIALLGINQTGAIPSDFGLLPKIDVCVLELPGQLPLVQLNKGDCELRNTLNELNFSNFRNHHHIRHQKHLENSEHQRNSDNDSSAATSSGHNYDPRSRIINKKVIMSKAVLDNYNNGSANR